MPPLSDEQDEKIDSGNGRTGQLIGSLVSTELERRTGGGRRRGPRLSRFRLVLAIVLLALTVTVYVSSLPVSSVLREAGGVNCIPGTGQAQASTGPGRVALIDQLALQYPNPGFVKSVERISAAAGRGFDYFPPEAATLDFFLNLPKSDYSILVLRTHGTGINAGDKVSIATGDLYSKNGRVGDQLLDRLIPVDINGQLYYGLTPRFITDVMCGRFQGTLILSMWCAGGGWTDLARAFVDKGAGAFIGWSGRVTVSHTDLAFQLLLELLLEGYAPALAVQNVMARLGPDPWTGARLVYHI